MRARWRLAASLSVLSAPLLAERAPAEAPPPPSVEAFFAEPASSGARLSPDGSHLVALASAGDEQVVLVWNLATRQRKPLVRFPKRESSRGRAVDSHLSSVFFVGNDLVALSLDHIVPFSKKPFLVKGLYTVDREGGEITELSKKWMRQNFIAWEVIPVQEDPRRVLVQGWSLGKRGIEVQEVDVRTGVRKLLQPGHRDVDQWIVDEEVGRVRLGVGFRGQRKSVYSVGSSVSMDLIRQLRLLVEPDFDPLAFGGDALYVASSHEGDSAGPDRTRRPRPDRGPGAGPAHGRRPDPRGQALRAADPRERAPRAPLRGQPPGVLPRPRGLPGQADAAAPAAGAGRGPGVPGLRTRGPRPRP